MLEYNGTEKFDIETGYSEYDNYFFIDPKINLFNFGYIYLFPSTI